MTDRATYHSRHAYEASRYPQEPTMNDLTLTDDIPTAAANPGAVLDVDFTGCPPVVTADGGRVIYNRCVALKAGGAGDVACYEALVDAADANYARRFEIGAHVAKWGNKISEKQAALIFDGLASYGKYRP